MPVWRKVEAEQKRSGRSYEDDNTTEEAARADYLKIAERRVRLGLLLAEIGDKADIKVSEEEVSQALASSGRARSPAKKRSCGIIIAKIPTHWLRSGPRYSRKKSSII